MTASSFFSHDSAIDSRSDFREAFRNVLQYQHLFNRKTSGGKINHRDLEDIRLTEENIERIYFCSSPFNSNNDLPFYEILGRMKYAGKPVFIHLMAVCHNCEEGDGMCVGGLMLFSWDGLSFMKKRMSSRYEFDYFQKQEIENDLLKDGMRYTVPILQNICLEFVSRNKDLYRDQLESLPKNIVESLKDIDDADIEELNVKYFVKN